MALVGCDNYEFVNLDENIVVKKDETKEYSNEIKWAGLNISSTVKAKYIDGRIHYRVVLQDLDGVPVPDTDYYENLKKGNLMLTFYDEDRFELHKQYIPIIDFTYYYQDNLVTSIGTQSSENFSESKFLKVDDIMVGTSGLN
tara:strand:- start:275 stop:700 length:426 start_codon:yes stop_codon:yes gene_type:complete